MGDVIRFRTKDERGQTAAKEPRAKRLNTEQTRLGRRLSARVLTHRAWDEVLTGLEHSSERVARTLDVTATVVVKMRKAPYAPVDIGDLVLVGDAVFEATVEMLRKMRAA